jgi:glutamate/tyrosine decarboxylase-like PLP-dependent enzyme
MRSTFIAKRAYKARRLTCNKSAISEGPEQLLTQRAMPGIAVSSSSLAASLAAGQGHERARHTPEVETRVDTGLPRLPNSNVWHICTTQHIRILGFQKRHLQPRTRHPGYE